MFTFITSAHGIRWVLALGIRPQYYCIYRALNAILGPRDYIQWSSIMLNLAKIRTYDRNWIVFAGLLVVIKLFILASFSSGYKEELFVPFVDHFLSFGGNPWDAFYSQDSMDVFPYPPLMLFVLSFFHFLTGFFPHGGVAFHNLIFKLPTLLADLLISWNLIQLFPNKKKQVVLFYFISPIVIYSCYIHSQLDLLPTAVLLTSINLLSRQKISASVVLMGLAISLKSHTLLALPLMMIYAYRNFSLRSSLALGVFPLLIHLGFALPYLSEAYSSLVLFNQKQAMIYDVFYKIGNEKIYLPIFAILAVYVRFFLLRKINRDLFFVSIGILYTICVLLICPGPAWYTWFLPYLCIFSIKFWEKSQGMIMLHVITNILYLVFFICFHTPEYEEVIFLGVPLSMKVTLPHLKDLAFTILEVALSANIYLLYSYGMKSNTIYAKQSSTLIGIAGDSGSGKSTLLEDIEKLIPCGILQLEGDGDHKWERKDSKWEKYTHLDPKANFLHRQADNLLNLKMGLPVVRGDYDHSNGLFTTPTKKTPKDIVIISGLHPFYLPKTRKLIDIKIYMDTQDQLRQHWKLLRDTGERDYSKETVESTMEKRDVDAKKYIYPQKSYADILIHYFTPDDFVKGSKEASFNMGLKLTLDANINLQKLLDILSQLQLSYEWDYSSDLDYQYLILQEAPPKEMIMTISRELIPNLEEIVGKSQAEWLDSFRGFVQLIVLMIISEKRQDKLVS
jgi:uridine kinase